MKLSIIIPVFNERLFIRRCLDSIKVHEDDLHDVEIIVIDDGSTDGTDQILDEFQDRVGFNIIKHSTNWGVAMTRNHGLSIAQGEYVTFLDADDELTEDGVDHLLTGCGCEFNILQFNHWRVGNSGWKDGRYYNAPGMYKIDKLPQKWLLVWNKVYKKSFLDAHGILFPENVSYEEDRIFNIRCLRHNPEIYHAKAAVVMKHHDNKQSICHRVSREHILTISSALVRELKEDNHFELDRVIRKSLADIWNSGIAKKLFGQES